MGGRTENMADAHMMSQIEKYADIYTSRVANLVPYSPQAVFSSVRQSLAHDVDSNQCFVRSSRDRVARPSEGDDALDT